MNFILRASDEKEEAGQHIYGSDCEAQGFYMLHQTHEGAVRTSENLTFMAKPFMPDDSFAL